MIRGIIRFIMDQSFGQFQNFIEILTDW